MTAVMLDPAKSDLTEAFEYYERQRSGLGIQFITEFRRGVDEILRHPNSWNPLDKVYRRYRLHRFPYGIVYRVDDQAQEAVLVAVMHLHRTPNDWRKRIEGQRSTRTPIDFLEPIFISERFTAASVLSFSTMERWKPKSFAAMEAFMMLPRSIRSFKRI
jgi:toxin ParE1/3/4